METTHTEWHPTKNGDKSISSVTKNSRLKYWWLCAKGHEYQARFSSHGSGCPICSGKTVLLGYNDLETLNPTLAAEWHPTNNKDITPKQVTSSSEKKVWWLGKCGHEWEAVIYHRSEGKSCPYCSGRKILIGFNDLATTHPLLAREWHPTKNGTLLPTEVSKGMNRKVWWRGKCGHEWEGYINNRSQGRGCPYCSGRKKEEPLCKKKASNSLKNRG